jgi:hypothetical protein
MSVGTKNKFALVIAAESTFATPVALTGSSGKFFPVRMDRPVVNIETATDEDTLTGVYESGLNSIVTKQTVSASVEMDARLDAIALFGKFALGNLSTGAAVGGVYPHTITVGTADAPSATAYFQDAFVTNTSTKAHQYAGMKVQRLTIRGDAGGKITMSAELIGSGVHTLDQTITAFPTVSTEGILGASRVGTFTLGGVNLKTVLKSFEFVFENVFDDAAEMVAGAKTLPAMERIGFNTSGSFTFKADAAASAKDLIDDILGNTLDQSISNAIVLTITGVDALAAHSCTINVYNAILDNTAITGQRAKLEKPIGFKGLYSVTDSKACQILVNNATASYAS